MFDSMRSDLTRQLQEIRDAGLWKPERVIGYGIEGGLFLKVQESRRKPDLQFILNAVLKVAVATDVDQ